MTTIITVLTTMAISYLLLKIVKKVIFFIIIMAIGMASYFYVTKHTDFKYDDIINKVKEINIPL
jgi:hypothetical protein